jgi:hypothetical protein
MAGGADASEYNRTTSRRMFYKKNWLEFQNWGDFRDVGDEKVAKNAKLIDGTGGTGKKTQIK